MVRITDENIREVLEKLRAAGEGNGTLEAKAMFGDWNEEAQAGGGSGREVLVSVEWIYHQ